MGENFDRKVGGGLIFINNITFSLTMAQAPPIEEWEFPSWLVCICESPDGFDGAAKLLVQNFGFVYSPFENPSKQNLALVLPRPDINLQDFIDKNEAFSWGIGSTRFDRYRYENQKRGPEYDFAYFPDCPWEFMKDNPSRVAMVELFKLLKPIRFLNYRGEEIPFPYKV